MIQENLYTTRLILSPVTKSDLDAVHELHSLPESDRYNTLGIPENKKVTDEIVNKWITENENKTNFTFKIELEDNTFIGLIGLKMSIPKYNAAEAWYKIHKDFWNNGYATEALKRILAFGFDELKLHRIEAGCAIENIGSVRTMEKAGMIKEGLKRKALPLKDGWSDTLEYAILSTDTPSGH